MLMAEWSDEIKQQVWNKVQEVSGCPPNIMRKDGCGAWIRWEDNGNRKGNLNMDGK